ncbi:drug/metabolite transporter (DMT)-like permease [Desulfobaculum xiamenense]|uniref:Drug/metabolite transporter (DMT)-like permease n=1 Tax=Desulfobaculum xiamenense TaxID=995050 RepID=A0A846QJ01_9BACT|nr:DMT family transporter [Desulfobaculum xiamenense]NJB67027.1 drug/metabolite transporter (DMT)-like permease [Desulfobaculum xiamenense]
MSCSRNRLVGIVFALAATVVWSGNFIVARGLVDSVPPVTLALLRWTTALVVLLPFGGMSFIRSLTAVRSHWRYLALTALLGVTIFNTLIYMAAHHTSALNLSLIATTSPMFILLFARIFLGEAVSPTRLGGVVVAVLGVIVLITRGQVHRLLTLELSVGDLGMLAAAMLFGAYSILVRRMPRDVPQGAFLTTTFGLGALMLVPWAAWEWSAGGVELHVTGQLVGAVLYIGAGASLFSFWCWNRAVEHIGPSMAGAVYYSLPLFSGIEAVVFLGEPVCWAHFLSGVLILGGIWLATRQGSRP